MWLLVVQKCLWLFKGPSCAFFFHFFSSTGNCVCKRSWKLKKRKVHALPQKTPLLMSRKHRAVILPLIISPLNITRHYPVTHLHDECLYSWWKLKLKTRPLTRWAVLAQARVSWPIRWNQTFGRGGLKETGAKTEHLTQRGNTALQPWDNWRSNPK